MDLDAASNLLESAPKPPQHLYIFSCGTKSIDASNLFESAPKPPQHLYDYAHIHAFAGEFVEDSEKGQDTKTYTTTASAAKGKKGWHIFCRFNRTTTESPSFPTQSTSKPTSAESLTDH